MYSLKISTEGKFWEVFLDSFEMIFYFVSTLSSIGGVLCSTIVSEQLKMKSLLIHYWQDVPSHVEFNKNVININELSGVSTSFVILHYSSL